MAKTHVQKPLYTLSCLFIDLTPSFRYLSGQYSLPSLHSAEARAVGNVHQAQLLKNAENRFLKLTYSADSDLKNFFNLQTVELSFPRCKNHFNF